MTDEEYYNPNFIDVHYLENILDTLGISYNLDNNSLDTYIQGVDCTILEQDKPIIESDIKFLKDDISKDIKEEILILLNDLREINIEEGDE